MIIFRCFFLSLRLHTIKLRKNKEKREKKERKKELYKLVPTARLVHTLFGVVKGNLCVLHIHDRAFTKKTTTSFIHTNAKKGKCANMPILRLVFFSLSLYLFITLISYKIFVILIQINKNFFSKNQILFKNYSN